MLANELLQVLRCLFTVIFWSMNKTDNELTQTTYSGAFVGRSGGRHDNGRLCYE